MSLSKKYAISEDTIKKMVKDGVISCSWSGREDIYRCFQKHLLTAPSKTRAVSFTCDEMNCHASQVWEAIRRFEH